MWNYIKGLLTILLSLRIASPVPYWGKLFGLDRTLAVLNEAPDDGVEETLKRVKSAVDAYVGQAAKFDDLTMMCVSYHGSESTQAMEPEERGEAEHE